MPHVGWFVVPTFPKPFSISPSEFVPGLDTYDFVLAPTGVKNRTTLGQQFFSAPVFLPHGAIVTKVQMWGYRDDAASTLEVILYQVDHREAQLPMATLTAGWTDGYNDVSDETINYEVIDNNLYSYALRLELTPNDAVSDVALTGVKIEWR